MKKLCEECKFRGVYDKNKSSLMGRLWRWHINFCPGWRLYYNSLDEAQKQDIKVRYNFYRD